MVLQSSSGAVRARCSKKRSRSDFTSPSPTLASSRWCLALYRYKDCPWKFLLKSGAVTNNTDAQGNNGDNDKDNFTHFNGYVLRSEPLTRCKPPYDEWRHAWCDTCLTDATVQCAPLAIEHSPLQLIWLLWILTRRLSINQSYFLTWPKQQTAT